MTGAINGSLQKLLPLHKAVSWHKAHPEASRLLPRHAQLYAELMAAVPGCGGLSEECVPTQAVAEARRRVVGGSALPAAELKQYKDLAALNSAMVAILDEYRQAFPTPSAPLSAAFAALPPPSVCERCRAVLKRWLREMGEHEVLTGQRWSPQLDEQLMEAASEFAKKLKKRSVAALTKLDMMSELGTLKSGLSGYEALGVRCMQLAKLPAGRVTQRWLLLRMLNTEVEKLVPLAHTGWTAEAHTLGARLCALRGLILMEVKRRVWDEALPEGPATRVLSNLGMSSL